MPYAWRCHKRRRICFFPSVAQGGLDHKPYTLLDLLALNSCRYTFMLCGGYLEPPRLDMDLSISAKWFSLCAVNGPNILNPRVAQHPLEPIGHGLHATAIPLPTTEIHEALLSYRCPFLIAQYVPCWILLVLPPMTLPSCNKESCNKDQGLVEYVCHVASHQTCNNGKVWMDGCALPCAIASWSHLMMSFPSKEPWNIRADSKRWRRASATEWAIRAGSALQAPLMVHGPCWTTLWSNCNSRNNRTTNMTKTDKVSCGFRAHCLGCCGYLVLLGLDCCCGCQHYMWMCMPHGAPAPTTPKSCVGDSPMHQGSTSLGSWLQTQQWLGRTYRYD